MAVTLTGSGGLFTRLGKIAWLLDTVNTFRGTTLPAEAEDAVETVDGADVVLRSYVSPLLAAVGSVQSNLGGIQQAAKTAAQNLLLEMVNDDNPLPERTVALALAELRRQMLASGHYVAANTVGASFTRTNLDGDGVGVASTLDGSGVPLENLLAEDLEIAVVNTATAGAEQLRVRGEAAVSDKLSHLWPAGSGADGSFSALAASAAGNLVTDGAFEALTGWTFTAGAGLASLASSGQYAGSKCLQLTGDSGGTLHSFYQAITGLASRTPYALTLWAKKSGSLAAGEITIDLFDGSSVIADESANDNELVFDQSDLTTSWIAQTAVFRLPEPVPDTVRLRIRATTALTDGENVFLDHLSLQRMGKLGSNVLGHTPFVAFASGSAAWTLDDYTWSDRVFKLATTNDRTSRWQQLFDQFFDAAAIGWTLPTSGSSEILDNLIS